MSFDFTRRLSAHPIGIERSLGLAALCGLAAFLRSGAMSAQETEPRLDYLSFAQGAIPVAVGGDPAARSNFEHAVKATDGDIGGFTYTSLIDPGASVEFVYELPAPTTFDRFAVPNILETPSPSQTFVRDIEVHGSVTSPTDGFVLLAAGELSAHSSKGEVSELALSATTPARWIKLVLKNGIDSQREKMFLEFSEIIGNGVQESVPLSDAFGGGWRGRGVAMLLQQDRAIVSGCYDRTGDLTGTVSGSILRAIGVDRNDGVMSAFVVAIGSSGSLQGVRSTNGAPFRLFSGECTDDTGALNCVEPAAPTLGCGSVIHGINFAFDSAAIEPESAPTIDSLFEGLADESIGPVIIEGHTSSEGSEAYNQALSERRANAVLDELVRRGMTRGRITAMGLGEARPIANNDDESGRSLNRRVEIHCTAP